MNRLLSLLVRLDGDGHVYVLHSIGETPKRALARHLYTTAKEAHDGERAAREWRIVGSWRVTATNTMEAKRQACEQAHRDAAVARNWERGSAAHGTVPRSEP